MARLNATWDNFNRRGQTWDHFWLDSGTIVLTLSDNVTVSDNQSSHNSYKRSISDSVTPSESLSKQSSIQRSISDNVVPSDSTSSALTRRLSLSDNITPSESRSSQITINKSLSDSVTPNESINSSLTRNKSLTDIITMSDVRSSQNAYNRQITDNITPSEQAIESSTKNRSIFDSVIVSDQESKSFARSKILSDNVLISDQLDKAVDLHVSINSDLSVEDSHEYVKGTHYDKILDDALTISDEERIKKDMQAFIADSLNISDEGIDKRDIFKSNEDFVNLSDEFEKESVIFEIIEDDITISCDFELYTVNMSNIRTSTPPNLIGKPNVDFDKGYFESLIWNKGYDVLVYQAIECPCKKNGSTNLTDCQNCLGLGWVFINPIETKAIITSINKDTKYKYWSPEMKGTIAITLRDIERLSFMDKIVIKNKTSVLSEIRSIKTITISNTAQKFVFLSFPAISVNSLFMFDGADKPLIRITEDKFEISLDNPYVIKLKQGITYPNNFNGVVSVDYNYKIQYNVVDIPHDLRVSAKVNDKGQIKQEDLPVQAIAQRSNYVHGDSPKYDGTGVQDNSYL